MIINGLKGCWCTVHNLKGVGGEDAEELEALAGSQSLTKQLINETDQ